MSTTVMADTGSVEYGCIRVDADRHDARWTSGSVRGCDHWEFRDGKVTRKDSYWKIVEKPA